MAGFFLDGEAKTEISWYLIVVNLDGLVKLSLENGCAENADTRASPRDALGSDRASAHCCHERAAKD